MRFDFCKNLIKEQELEIKNIKSKYERELQELLRESRIEKEKLEK